MAKVLADSVYNIHRLLWDLFPGQKQRNFLYREEIAREQLGYQGGARGESLYYLVSSSAPSSQSPFFAVETRRYEPQLQPDEALRFELRANPVVTKNGKKHDVVMDAQQTFLKLLCEELGLLSHLQGTPEKKEYKNVLLTHGGQRLDSRLTDLLDGDYRYAERLDQKLTPREKLEWALRAEIDNTLDEWMAKQGKQNGFTIVKDTHGNLKLQNSAYQWHALTGKAAKGKKSGFSAVDFTGDLVVSDVEAFKKSLFNGIGRSKAFGCGLMLVKRI
ncbi:CRISPR-associated protein, Cse3 family [Desulfosudis oleivorans Hxd3]|uniref:CRISPR-associated protein, Cse3 family n=2 Tax=Desulfosudis TaxID=2904716 RepID=A8ZZ18_DESOH|nr:CRISPR-associated protein, Cse3 family [Desulfosudis oleivorans Hxd3]